MQFRFFFFSKYFCIVDKNFYRLRVRCLTLLSTIFLLYRGGQFYRWRKPLTCLKSLTNFITMCCIEYTSPERVQTHNVSGDGHWLCRYHVIMTSRLSGFRVTMLVVICTDCIGTMWSRWPPKLSNKSKVNLWLFHANLSVNWIHWSH